MRHFGKIDGIPVAITDHALERMAEMDVKAVEFHALITNPDEVYRSKKYPDAVCHRKGKYSIALNKEPNLTTVITVLYGSLEDWCEAAKEGKLSGQGRKIKIVEGMPRRRRS